MNDDAIWAFEESLWTADAEHYQRSIDDQCLMVLPEQPYVLSGQEAKDAVKHTPRWSRVELGDRRVSRPQDGVIVIAYAAQAEREGKAYHAHCTSTYRQVGADDWRVIQHQQTPPQVAG